MAALPPLTLLLCHPISKLHLGSEQILSDFHLSAIPCGFHRCSLLHPLFSDLIFSVVSLPIPVPKCVNFRGWRWCSTLYCSWPYSLMRWILFVFELFDKLFSPFQLWYLQVNGLNFHLEPNTRKCLKEEIHKVPKNGIKCINLMVTSIIVVNNDSWQTFKELL